MRQPGDQHLKHSLISASFFTLALAGSLAAQDVLSPLYGTVQPARTCESLTGMELADADVDATVESATVESAGDVGPSYCRVTVAAGHPPAGDRITIWVALPLEGWNGRFLGTGGGGFSGGSPGPLPGAVRGGFAAAATDTGHAGASGSFALGANGRDHGGKAIVWHGWNDPLIYAQGTIDWFEGVENRMGDTGDFLRLFLPSGVEHCRHVPGLSPDNPFAAVVRWVEEGIAPETLDGVRRDGGGAILESRPICRHPLAAVYSGSGSLGEAASFECREEVLGR